MAFKDRVKKLMVLFSNFPQMISLNTLVLVRNDLDYFDILNLYGFANV